MYSEIFPQRIKKARTNAGYSQEQIAEELEINRTSISKYETGSQEPSLETLAKLAQFYNVSIDWLLGVNIINDNHESKKNENKKNIS